MQERVDIFSGPFAVGNDGKVYRFSILSGTWDLFASPSPPAVQIAAQTLSPYTPWIVDTDGDIQEWNGSAFAHMNSSLNPPFTQGCRATDIAVTPNNIAFVTACGRVWSGDNNQLLWGVDCDRDANESCTGPTADAVSVDGNGNPWIIDPNGAVFFWNGQPFPSGAFVALGQGQLVAKPHALSVGTPAAAPPLAWGLGLDADSFGNNGSWAWVGDQWLPIGGGFISGVSVDPNFPYRVVAITSDGTVWDYSTGEMSPSLTAAGSGTYELNLTVSGLAGGVTLSLDGSPDTASPIFLDWAPVGSDGTASFVTTVPSCPHSLSFNVQMLRAYDSNDNIGLVYESLFNRSCN
ncbi:MAG: hypothetical protein FWD17_11310 [Polyangiaceae bacterium]|nr:hypothetical protein [Polyangiaceae bacterium]